MLQRTAGILIPLFSLRTADDLGRGEIMQMKPMIDFAISIGHRMIQLLPLDETAPGEPSPYAALSLFAIDPLYISAAEVSGVDETAMQRAREKAGAPARRIPREKYVALKKELLECAFEAFASRADTREQRALDDFIEENSYWIHDHALFRALKDHFAGRSWEEWPGDLARREQPALASARRELAQSIQKYCYFQFIAHQQWKSIRDYAKERGIYIGGDLAFAPGRDSDVVWAHQECFDLTRIIGAPPDVFSATGQRWGLPMPNLAAMRADGFQIWRSRMRHARALYDAVRIDHVVGLYRTFSFGFNDVVRGRQPIRTQLFKPRLLLRRWRTWRAHTKGKWTPKGQQRQRAQGEAVLRAIKDEARELQIIAEDLGKMPLWVRKSLAELGLPGYKVMRWQRDWRTPKHPYISPADYPELSLATTGTHDTEALTMWWREQTEEERAMLMKTFDFAGRVNPRAPLKMAALNEILRTLYAAPSILTVLPIQDLFGWSARINRPDGVKASNWTYRLPLPLERMATSHAIQSRARDLREIAIRSKRFSA